MFVCSIQGDKKGSKLVDDLKAALDKEKKSQGTHYTPDNECTIQIPSKLPLILGIFMTCLWSGVGKVLKQKQDKIDHLVAELNATRDSVGEKHSVADAAIRQ